MPWTNVCKRTNGFCGMEPEIREKGWRDLTKGFFSNSVNRRVKGKKQRIDKKVTKGMTSLLSPGDRKQDGESLQFQPRGEKKKSHEPQSLRRIEPNTQVLHCVAKRGKVIELTNMLSPFPHVWGLFVVLHKHWTCQSSDQSPSFTLSRTPTFQITSGQGTTEKERKYETWKASLAARTFFLPGSLRRN